MRRDKCLRYREQEAKKREIRSIRATVATLLRECTCALSYYIYHRRDKKIAASDVSFIFKETSLRLNRVRRAMASRMFANTTGKLFAFVKL